MAIPLAIDRVRGQRSYGLVVGLAMLIAFHQLLQLGEALADNNKIPVWARPVAAVRRCSRRSRRGCSCAPPPACPIRAWASGSTGSSTASAGCCRGGGPLRRPRMSVLARLPQPHVPGALPGRPVRDHRLRHRHRPDRRRPRAGAARPRVPSPRACAISACGCRSCCPSSCRSRPCWPGCWRSPTCCATAS